MKKTYYYLFMVLAIIAVTPTVTFGMAVVSDTSTAKITTSSTSTAKDKLRAVVNNVEQKYENKLQNVKTNKDIRNITIEARTDMKKAFSSLEKKEIRLEMRKDIFSAQLSKIIREITLSLNNLKQIRARIETRIEKAVQTGRDMSKAKNLLVTADAKITLAEQAINSLKSLATSTPNVSVAATSTIKLEKPRQVGADAIKAVKDAHKALGDVVIAIAHDMGIKLGITATSTTTVKTEIE